MARISCQSQLISDTWRANLATNWRFSRPRPLRERMKRKSCHGSPPENTLRRDLATVGRRGTHFASILPSASARAPGHGTATAHGRGVAGCGRVPDHRHGCRLRVGTRPRGGDCRLRAGPPTAARSAANRLSTARTSAMPKTRMNPFTPTFPRYCTVIGFICYVTNI